jgi:hypothetical protein
MVLVRKDGKTVYLYKDGKSKFLTIHAVEQNKVFYNKNRSYSEGWDYVKGLSSTYRVVTSIEQIFYG